MSLEKSIQVLKDILEAAEKGEKKINDDMDYILEPIREYYFTKNNADKTIDRVIDRANEYGWRPELEDE